jgi:hypothetical protein
VKLQPNQQEIIDLLSDGAYHCPTKELYQKDDRARISALRKLGFVFDSPRCNMRHNYLHGSGVVMRKLVSSPVASQEAPVAPLPFRKAINPVQPLFPYSVIDL